jgi:hypothetical protein
MALESEGLRLNLEKVSAGVRAVLEDSHKGTYWIAEENGKVGSMWKRRMRLPKMFIRVLECRVITITYLSG